MAATQSRLDVAVHLAGSKTPGVTAIERLPQQDVVVSVGALNSHRIGNDFVATIGPGDVEGAIRTGPGVVDSHSHVKEVTEQPLQVVGVSAGLNVGFDRHRGG